VSRGLRGPPALGEDWSRARDRPLLRPQNVKNVLEAFANIVLTDTTNGVSTTLPFSCPNGQRLVVGCSRLTSELGWRLTATDSPLGQALRAPINSGVKCNDVNAACSLLRLS
jgi:hypothetical protein